MRKILPKTSMVLLFLVLLTVHVATVLAQDGEMLTGEEKVKVIEQRPQIVKSEKIEMVPQKDGSLKPAKVQQISLTQVANIIFPQVSVGGVDVTKWRALQYAKADPYNFTGRVAAQTRTNKCIDEVYVKARLRVVGPSGDFWGPTNSNSDWGLCKDDTGQAWTSWEPWIKYGSTLHAVGDHRVKINSVTTLWNGEHGPSVTPIP